MCACFQKRIGETKIESLRIKYVPVQDMKKWSIALGFEGKCGEEFYKKYESVVIVRERIFKEFFYGLVGAISFFAIVIYSVYNDMLILLIPTLVFTGLSCFSIVAHSKIILEWKRHDKEMIKQWTEKN